MNMVTAEELAPVKKRFFGEILISRGLITKDQLKDALMVQEMQGGYFGEVLTGLGYINERDVVTALGIQCHVPYIAIDRYVIEQDVIDLIPEEIARKHNVMPLDCVNNILSLVMADPLEWKVKSEVMRVTHCRIAPFIATSGEIKRAIHLGYDR